jgi:hypothetical protein
MNEVDDKKSEWLKMIISEYGSLENYNKIQNMGYRSLQKGGNN